jgi:hypothetical protein
MSSSIPSRQWKIVAQRSGDRCAICKKPLTIESEGAGDLALIGEMAHIKGEKPGSARYDPDQPVGERNSYRNLIYLCANDHTMIDQQEDSYPVEKLLRIKLDHEKWVGTQLGSSLPRVTFRELELVSEHILSTPVQGDRVYTITPPADKIKKNDLTERPGGLITMGLGKAFEVQRFVDQQMLFDPQYADRLRSGFLAEYYRLRSEGLRGDDLFDGMLDHAIGATSDFNRQAAGLAVLSYLFEKCDIFER